MQSDRRLRDESGARSGRASWKGLLLPPPPPLVEKGCYCRVLSREMTPSDLFKRIPLAAVLKKKKIKRKRALGQGWKQGDQLQQELTMAHGPNPAGRSFENKPVLEHSYAHLHYNGRGEELPQCLYGLKSGKYLLCDPL